MTPLLRTWRRRLWLPLLFLLFFALCLVLEKSSLFEELREASRTDTVSTGVLNYGPLGKILKRLGLVHLVKNDGSRFPPTEGGGTLIDSDQQDLELIAFQKKRKVDEYLYEAQPGGASDILARFFPQGVAAKQGWPILAIQLPPEDLYDEQRGIIANRGKKGREWERAADVCLIADGAVELFTAAGLRIHGGKRRIVQPFQSYRLHFRKKYGIEAIPDGILLDIGVPVKTLVVHIADWPAEMPMNNPLAYDIANRIGSPAPVTRLVEVYLNGVSQGMAYITEHLSRRQWGQRMGDRPYMFYKFRSEIPLIDQLDFTKRVWSLIHDQQNFGMARAAAAVDLDTFTRHVFSWVFNGTSDYCQGVAVLDKADPEAKLRYIQWDMDHSFWDYSAETDNFHRPNWQQESFEIIHPESHTCERTKLFSRLLDESQEYREYAFTLFTDILNHRLTQPFLSERVGYYERMMRAFGVPHADYVAILEDFMRNRPDFIRKEMAKRFKLNGPFSCTVGNDDRLDLLIDGHPYGGDYSGWYFHGQTIRITLAGKSPGQVSWQVNGETVIAPSLELAVEGDLHIEAISGHR